MANVETGFYSNAQAPDFMGATANGLKLRDMVRQQKVADQAKNFQDTLKTAYTPDPTTGQLTFDSTKLKDLAQIDPQKAYEMQTQMRQQQLEAQKQKMEMQHVQLGDMARILGSASDQSTYDAAVKDATDKGYLHAGEAPAAYDPTWVKGYAKRALSYQEQLADMHKGTEEGFKKQEADAKTSEADTAAKKLPMEQQKVNAEIEANRLKRNEQVSQHQGQNLQNTMQMLESARGNPAVAQAQKDVYAAQKLNSLIGNDPNKASPQMVQLAASEVAKIAQGGVPQTTELQHLTPSSLPGTLANAAQYFLNNPTPANQGAFLKQYQDYANAVGKDARGVIREKYSRVLEGKKRVLNPADYDTLKSNYLDPLEEQKGSHPVDNMNDADVVKAWKAMKGIQ